MRKIEALKKEIFSLLKKTNLSISIAESCTGGMLSSFIVDLPGVSKFYKGGIVAYDNYLKIKLLRIQEDIIKKFGAVSSITASLMAKNIKVITHSNIGIATTGIAGPTGGTPQKPIGLVFIGIASEYATSYKFIFQGSRNTIRKSTCWKALNLLKQHLLVYRKRF